IFCNNIGGNGSPLLINLTDELLASYPTTLEAMAHPLVIDLGNDLLTSSSTLGSMAHPLMINIVDDLPTSSPRTLGATAQPHSSSSLMISQRLLQQHWEQ